MRLPPSLPDLLTLGADRSVEEVNMQEGDIFMMRYRVLQPLLAQKKVELL